MAAAPAREGMAALASGGAPHKHSTPCRRAAPAHRPLCLPSTMPASQSRTSPMVSGRMISYLPARVCGWSGGRREESGETSGGSTRPERRRQRPWQSRYIMRGGGPVPRTQHMLEARARSTSAPAPSRGPVLEHAVLVDAALVRKCVGAHHRLRARRKSVCVCLRAARQRSIKGWAVFRPGMRLCVPAPAPAAQSRRAIRPLTPPHPPHTRLTLCGCTCMPLYSATILEATLRCTG